MVFRQNATKNELVEWDSGKLHLSEFILMYIIQAYAQISWFPLLQKCHSSSFFSVFLF